MSTVYVTNRVCSFCLHFLHHCVRGEANIAKSCYEKSIGHMCLLNNLVLVKVPVKFLYFSLETAFLRASGVGCAYLIVIWIELCPRSLDTVARSTPASTSLVAKVCLRSWNLRFFIPARLQALLKAFLILPIGLPL